MMEKTDLGDLGVPIATPDKPFDQAAEAHTPDVQAVPPLADLVSREIRRMGRGWKIEGVKSLVQVLLTLLVTTVLGAGWIIFVGVVTTLGWYLWSRISVKATIEPYRLRKR